MSAAERAKWAHAAAVHIGNGSWSTGLMWLDELADHVHDSDRDTVAALRARTEALRTETRAVLDALDRLGNAEDAAEAAQFWRDGEWQQTCACRAMPSPHAPRDRHPADRTGPPWTP